MPEFIQPCFKVLVVLADTNQLGKLFHIYSPAY